MPLLSSEPLELYRQSNAVSTDGDLCAQMDACTTVVEFTDWDPVTTAANDIWEFRIAE